MLVQSVHFAIEWTFPRIQHVEILQVCPRWQSPQACCANAVFGEKVIDELVDVCECEGVLETTLDLAVVGKKGLERLVDFDRLPGKADVKGSQTAQVLEVAQLACRIEVVHLDVIASAFVALVAQCMTILYLLLVLLLQLSILARRLLVVSLKVEVLEDDGLVWHQLQQLKGQAQKGRRLARDARGAANELEVGGAIAQGGGVEAKALLLPVVRLGDALAHALFKEQRRVLAADEGAAVAAVVEERARVGAVKLWLGHGGGGRFESKSCAALRCWEGACGR